jgi:hypothetical protein
MYVLSMRLLSCDQTAVLFGTKFSSDTNTQSDLVQPEAKSNRINCVCACECYGYGRVLDTHYIISSSTHKPNLGETSSGKGLVQQFQPHSDDMHTMRRPKKVNINI